MDAWPQTGWLKQRVLFSHRSECCKVLAPMRALFLAHKELLSLLTWSGEDEGKWEWGKSERREGKDEKQEQIRKEREREREEESTLKGHIRLP